MHFKLRMDAQRAVQRLKNALKKSYVEDCLSKFKNELKKLWREIRQFWPSSKSSLSKIGNVRGATTNEGKASVLNEHFSTIGEKLSAEIPNTVKALLIEDHVYPPTFELHLFDNEDMILAIKRLSNSKLSAFDGITSYMVKSCQTEIAPILTSMYNLSLKTRTFRKPWKKSKVTSLHKGGQTNNCNNYRPISITPTVGKVMERMVHQQCTQYLTDRNILLEAQSGF